jgi:hypothetical protein
VPQQVADHVGFRRGECPGGLFHRAAKDVPVLDAPSVMLRRPMIRLLLLAAVDVSAGCQLVSSTPSESHQTWPPTSKVTPPKVTGTSSCPTA